MSEANKAVVRRWFEEVWNQRKAEVIDELLAADGVGHGLGTEIRGPQGFRQYHKNFLDAVPDAHIAVEHLIAEGDFVAVHCTVTGTHSGGGLNFAATNRAAKFGGIVLIRLRNGQFLEGWNYFDFLGFYNQLGVVQMPGA